MVKIVLVHFYINCLLKVNINVYIDNKTRMTTLKKARLKKSENKIISRY